MKDQDTLAAKQIVASMSFWEKVKYYLGYYKIHIIVVALLVAGLAFMISSYVNAPNTVLYLGVMDGKMEKSQNLVEDYCATLENISNPTIDVNVGLSMNPTTDGMQLYSEIQLKLASKSLDIVFTTAEGVPYLAKSGVLMEPETWLTDNLKSAWSERIKEFETLEEGTGMSSTDTFSLQPIALDVSGTVFATMYGLDENSCYLVVPSNTERMEAIQLFLEYIYNLEK